MAQGIILHRNRNVNTTKIYGISRDITNSSPLWARTDNAIGLTATASIGTTTGISSFNNIYPWKDIVRETLSTGDIMVKIPKFYFKRYVELNVEYIKITDQAADGFTLHPLFNRVDGVKDYIYVGAYKTSFNNSTFNSFNNKYPLTSFSTIDARNGAVSKGTGWGLIDIATLSAIQMLILVEFANNDVQSVIGMGYSNVNNTSKKMTGLCDNVINLTGIPTALNDGKTGVVWRGIEDMWGNVAQYIDGIKWYNGIYYICNNQSQYNSDNNSTNYIALSYTSELSWSSKYIVMNGIDSNNTHIMLPNIANTQGGGDKYFCDTCSTFSGSQQWCRFDHGGIWNAGTKNGLFFSRFYSTPGNSSSTLGSRLMYLPQS